MIYLKKFNEVNDPYDDYINKLEKISNDSLAYLIDEGFIISIKDNKVNYDSIEIKISKNRTDSYFKWSEVKDDIIQFLEFISESYELEDEPINFVENFSNSGISLDTYTYSYSLDDVINNTGYFVNDEVSFYDDTDDISYISIYIKQPKPLD
mgnify:FL=1